MKRYLWAVLAWLSLAGLGLSQAGNAVNGAISTTFPSGSPTPVVGGVAIVSNGQAVAAFHTQTSNVIAMIVTGQSISPSLTALASTGNALCTMDSYFTSGGERDYVVISPTVDNDCHAQATLPAPGTTVIGFLDASSTATGVKASVLVSGSFVVPATGGGAGNVSTAPSTSQDIVQPPNTETSTTNFANIPYGVAAYNWAQTLSSNLTAGTPATVTLTPCPLGVDGRDNIGGGVYLTGDANPEVAYTTGGGTCIQGNASGTITFTPVFSHSSGITIGSFSSGLYETMAAVHNWSTAAHTHSDNYAVVWTPAGSSTSNGNTAPTAYAVYGHIEIPGYNFKIDARGAQLLCYTRDYCIGQTKYGNSATIQGIRMASEINVDGWDIASTQCVSNVVTINTTAPHTMVVGDMIDVDGSTDNNFYWGGSASWVSSGSTYGRVSAVTSTSVSYPVVSCGASDTSLHNTPGHINVLNAAILANAGSMEIDDFDGSISGGSVLQITGHFNNGIVNLNDQHMVINNTKSIYLTQAGSSSSTCSSTHHYCGKKIYGPGPVGRNAGILNMSNYYGNVTCTGNDIGWYAGNTLKIDNAVVEAPTSVGLVLGGPLGGFGSSVLTNVYIENGGCNNPDTPGNVPSAAGFINYAQPMQWNGGEGPQGVIPQFATGGGTTYYYYLMPCDSFLGCGPALYFGNAAPSGSTVSIFFPRVLAQNTLTYTVIRSTTSPNNNLPYTAACQGGSASACGSVTTGMAQCSGLFCSYSDDVTVSTTAVTIPPAPSYAPLANFWPGNGILENGGNLAYSANTNVAGIVNLSGTATPSVFTPYNPNTNQQSAWQQTLGGSTTVLDDTNTTPGLKGRLNFVYPPGANVQLGDYVTFLDSNPAKTLATRIKRPTMDTADSGIGNDVGNTSQTTTGLYLRTPVSLSHYINCVPGQAGCSPSEQLTAALKKFTIPVLLQSDATVLGQCYNCSPFPLGGTQVSDNFQRANGPLGANWTVSDGTWAILNNTATYTAVGGDGLALAVYTNGTFSNDQSSQALITSLGLSGGQIGLAVRGSNSVTTTYEVDISGTSGSATAALRKVITGSATNLNLSCGTNWAIGQVVKLLVVGTKLSLFQNGVSMCTATDASIISGYPGLFGRTGGSGPLTMTNFVAGDATYITPYNVFTTGASFGASGANHSSGFVPDPGSSAGASRFLREDGVWQTGTALSTTGRCYAYQQAGADICAQIAACYNGAGTTSSRAGVIDAISGYSIGSVQACNSNPFPTNNKSGELYLGSYTIATSSAWIMPQKKFTIIGTGGGSPLGNNGNVDSAENTIIEPCVANGNPTGCTSGFQKSSNQLFIEPVYNITGCTDTANVATCTTSTNHNYTFTSGGIASQVTVSGMTPSFYNVTNVLITAATSNTFSYAAVGSGSSTVNGTVTAPQRSHGLYSATGSGFLNPGNYYALVAMGGGNHPPGYDTLGTCGTGPVGADWTLSGFGAQLRDINFNMLGLAGVGGVYSGNEQERSRLENVTYENFGGVASGTEGFGLMMDRNAWNLNDACSNPSGNGGPSHFIGGDGIFCDASPATGAGNQGTCVVLAGNHTPADGSSAGGLAHFGFKLGTVRGLGGGSQKMNYGFWIENYDNGAIEFIHFENVNKDPIYLHGTNGWTSQGWVFTNNDFGSTSGTNNAVVHFDLGTNNNILLNARGGSVNPAGIRDEVYGCPGAFGSPPPCIINGASGGNPTMFYQQGGMNIWNMLQFGNSASGPTYSGGTGAPTGSCVNGSIWVRSDNGSGSSMYVCKNSLWSAIN